MLKLNHLRIVVPTLAMFVPLVSFAQTATLSTIFDGGSRNFGSAFDVTNLTASPISLTGAFEGSFNGGYQGGPPPFPEVEVWVRDGSLDVAALQSTVGWSLFGTDNTVAPTVNEEVVAFDVNNVLPLAPGETKGILLYARGGSNVQPKPIVYTETGGGPNFTSFDDGTLRITNFYGMGFADDPQNPNFTSSSPPLGEVNVNGRTWNGTIEYDTSELVPATVFTWQADDVGNWADQNSWSFAPPASNGLANNADHTAIFGSATSSTTTAVTNADVTLNRIEFNDFAKRYIVGGGGSVNLAATTDPVPVDPSVTVVGTHEFQAGVNLTADATIDVTNSSTLTFNNALRLMGHTLTKTGAGTLDINNVLSLGGGTIDIQQGTVSGNGTIGGDVNNNSGMISPGNSLQQTSAVPEPANLVLLVLGTVGVFSVQRACRKRDS